MNQDELLKLLQAVRQGHLEPEEATRKLSVWPLENLDEACLDHQRALRKGFPEVVFGEGKTRNQLTEILGRMAEVHPRVLATRVDQADGEWISQKLEGAEYHSAARVLTIGEPPDALQGHVLVVCAGTTDLPVAEEACLTLRWMGSRVEKVVDVGVAGLHRILSRLELLRSARVVIVVAGMDGALASVVGGLVACPVIGVPTSVGYGASFQGVAPLLTMLNSCAPGVTVVNIDNGFGAAYAAHRMNVGAAQ